MELHIWIPAFAASALLLLPYCNLVVKVNAELREEREHPEMNPQPQGPRNAAPRSSVARRACLHTCEKRWLTVLQPQHFTLSFDPPNPGVDSGS